MIIRLTKPLGRPMSHDLKSKRQYAVEFEERFFCVEKLVV